MIEENKIFAIGDIHGCYKELMLLFDKLPLDPEKDEVVFLGDYIDRGPDSKKVVEQLIKWKKKYSHWTFLQGNHEDIFYDFVVRKGALYGINNWFANGGKETYKSYDGHFGKVNGEFEAPKPPDLPKEHLDFLFKELPLTYETDEYFFVHGGVIPEASLEESKPFWKTLLWAREGFIDSDYDWGKKVIFGHSPNYQKRWKGKMGDPIIMDNKIGLDGAVSPPGNANLLALELPSEKIYKQPNVTTKGKNYER